MLTVQEARKRAQTVPSHDLHLRVAPRETLPHERVVGDTEISRELEQTVELDFETDRHRRRRFAPLEAEQGHGDRPSVVHTTDNIFLRTHRVGEENLVELVVARDHLDRAYFDTWLPHRHKQKRDALVLWCIGVGAG